MPFAYYGAKHGLARKYPRPRHNVIVEPFAGSAAYSVFHAYSIDHAILIDADMAIVELWHELQTMTAADVDLIGEQLNGTRIDHPLLAGLAGGSQMAAILNGKTRAVTPRMRTDWPRVSNRIKRALPRIKTWEVNHGQYSDAPTIDATWFIDPPYQENGMMAGSGYRECSARIDFNQLSEWCMTRPGFAMVCEQSPANWLPFYPFATQGNGAGVGSMQRHELIWQSDMGQPTLWETA